MTVEQLEALASAHMALAAAYTTVAQEVSDVDDVDDEPAPKKKGKGKKAADEETPAPKKGKGKGRGKKKPEPEPEPEEDEDDEDEDEESDGDEEITKASLTKMIQEISALGKKATTGAKTVLSEYGAKNLKTLDEEDYVDCYNDLVEVFNEHAE